MSAPLVFRSPIFGREVSAALRRPRAYVAQAIYQGGLIVVLFFLWPHGVAGAAATGRRAFEALAGILLAAAALVSPALSAPAVAVERRRGTLGLLAMAGASPLRIVGGKALGALALSALVIIEAMPAAAALFVAGGVTGGEVATVFAGALGLAALGTGLGALFSGSARRPETATLAAIAVVGAIAAFPLVLEGRPFPARFLSPVAWFAAVRDPLAGTGAVEFRGFWVAPLLHAALGALATAAGAGSLARHGFEPLGAERRLPLGRFLLRFRRRRGPLGLPGPLPAQVAAIRWRERSVRAVSDGTMAAALGGFILAFELFLPPAERAALRAGTATALAALATLLATVLGAAAIARERDRKTIEPLAAAPIEAEKFLLGKLLGLGRAVSVVATALVAHVALGALRGDAPPIAALAIALTLPFALAFHALMGLWFSSRGASMLRAMAASLATAVLVAAISPYGRVFHGL
jgi:ABC-type transport system involved in multi-copper enzyme maturation permease subunit